MTFSKLEYPIKGIFYFLSHWSLVREVLLVILLTVVVSIFIISLTFVVLLGLQAGLFTLLFIPPPFSFILAFILCIIESVVFIFIFYLVATPQWQDELFDNVLRLKGLGSVLDKPRHTDRFVLLFRGIGFGIELTFFQVLTLIITIPINAIPVAGTVLYCIINGWQFTWGHQIHYHMLVREYTVKQSREFAWKDRYDYIAFGSVGMALQLIPVANFIFFWTTIVGAALWTADVLIEEQKAAADEEEQNITVEAVGTSSQSTPAVDESTAVTVTATNVNNYGATTISTK
ncbi:28744_t:CDS:2 [Dentiscutata erythropus]|uniref:28744_t:CDS:1 n=1 Tax=Dentiscutata erythropus TaxID=1348616 RepID=A0A9N8ZKN1_9GLOM|nr:28744_t:CDS:2 [Dentiscutata erythropus]